MTEREKQYTEQREIYRTRLYSVKQTIYAGYLAFDGMVLAVCSIGASLKQTEFGWQILMLVFLTLLSVLIVMLILHSFVYFYDWLAFRKTPKTEDDWEREQKELLNHWEHFARRGRLRKKADWLLLIILILRTIGIAIYVQNLVH